jgi:hypothetical protein
MIDGAEINEGSLSPSGNIDTSPAIPNFSSREDEIKKEEFERIRKRALDVLEYDDYLIRDGEGRRYEYFQSDDVTRRIIPSGDGRLQINANDEITENVASPSLHIKTHHGTLEIDE